jgi:uncharacterized protein YndB with AHSA1/START domain
VKKFLLVAVLLVGGLWYYGRSLPREHSIKSSITITAPVDTVFKVVRAIGSQPVWWSDVKSVRPLLGRRRESWEQNMGGGAGLIAIEVTSVNPGVSMKTTIITSEEQDEADQDWGGTWSYRVIETSSGTQIQITEEGWVDPPFMRIVMKLRGRYRTVDSYLSSLAAHFGEVASPRHGTES